MDNVVDCCMAGVSALNPVAAEAVCGKIVTKIESKFKQKLIKLLSEIELCR